VFKDCVCDMVVEIGKLGIPTRETAENNYTVTQNAGSYILTLLLQRNNQISKILHAYL
jgi:hypothetical protein